jgi:hypothetical protein
MLPGIKKALKMGNLSVARKNLSSTANIRRVFEICNRLEYVLQHKKGE